MRQATVHDLEKLYKIERECFTAEAFSKEFLTILLQDLNSVSLIAQMDGEIVGFIIGLIQEVNGMKIGHICTIDIAIKHRRKGVGIRLLKEIEEAFTKKGVQICYLEVRLSNFAAIELYRKRGYTEIEKLSNYYSKGMHGIRLQKQLSQ
jgi:ribosomal-protein-alanine N-acetyltransferase